MKNQYGEMTNHSKYQQHAQRKTRIWWKSSPSSVARPPLSILKTTSRGRVVQQPVRFADYDMSAGRRRKWWLLRKGRCHRWTCSVDRLCNTKKPSCRWQTRATRKNAKNCSNSTCLQRCRWYYWSIFIRLAVCLSEICEIPQNSLKIQA